MSRKLLMLLAVAAGCAGGAAVLRADDSRPYAEGPVLQLTYIKVKPGMFNAYMKYVDTTYKRRMEEQKKAGIILDFSVYEAQPRSPREPDLVFVTTYKNLAAMDDLEDRTDPIDRQIWASRDVADKADVDRAAMREVLGVELLRQLKLK